MNSGTDQTKKNQDVLVVETPPAEKPVAAHTLPEVAGWLNQRPQNGNPC